MAFEANQYKLDEFLTTTEAHALAQLAGGKPLGEVLDELCQIIESVASDRMLVSVLLLSEDKKHLVHGAAPSLPSEYSKAVDGIEIGIKAGSCGTAAFCRHAIFVVDIESDPLWEEFKVVAIPHGLRACWSVPLIDDDQNLLGTFAIYHTWPRSPSNFERELIARAGVLVTRILTMSDRQQGKLVG
jgi:GAF domain-containing protein